MATTTKAKKVAKKAPKAASKTAVPKVETPKASLKDLAIGEGIGFIAGDIYTYLYKNGEASLIDLKNELKQTPAMIQFAVGWLARENNVVLSKKGAGYMIRLNK
ncbi:MAG: winged helix-turn-helix domain-containing protein [Candidatus Eisenbacteria bacterium]|uniref:Winged helix-turn-helix domain-containing protein n=1 Tax=Eiseniibacteriota bacterium TaxID=2212470 RepID=A0A7Y2ED56_UNCEI|nr:winged helix-turn-helix domain-containing protein [Candidatus Eisenbacteria bacterium]